MACRSLSSLTSEFKPHGKLLTWLQAIAILAGTAVVSPIALAGNTGWYVGADAGQPRFTGVEPSGSPVQPYQPYSFSSTDTGYRLSAGYRFNPYFGLEAGYVDLGKITGSSNEPPAGIHTLAICGGPNCPPVLRSFAVAGKLKTHGWTLAFVGSYPFDDRWAVFGRVGAIQAHSELDTHVTPVPLPNLSFIGPSTTSVTNNDVDATFGLGLQWSFASDWAARLSWDRYASLGHDLPMGKFNVNLTSLGIVYQF